jgi:hypothetical protein
MVADKIFLAISTLYLFNQSRGKQVDFNATFHLVLVPDFTGVLPIKFVTTQHKKYLANESRLDI